MCKYNSYAIEIVHLNGNRQVKQAKDPTSYNSTMSLYRKTKEEYIDKNVTINFVGFTEDKKGILFTKQNNSYSNDKKNIKALIDVIYEASIELSKQFSNINDKVGLYDKKRDSIDHLLVEAIDINEITEKDKAKIFDEIREVNLIRRDYKILGAIRQQCINEIQNLVKDSTKLLKSYEQNINKNNNKLKSLIKKEDKLTDLHIVKEYKYKNHNEKMSIMKEIKNKYDRIVNFPEKKILVCYNKCYR